MHKNQFQPYWLKAPLLSTNQFLTGFTKHFISNLAYMFKHSCSTDFVSKYFKHDFLNFIQHSMLLRSYQMFQTKHFNFKAVNKMYTSINLAYYYCNFPHLGKGKKKGLVVCRGSAGEHFFVF